MAKCRIIVLSHYLFDEVMRKMGLNDENVENTNMAFISIIGTPECLKYYLEEEDTKHYFKDHKNVLNLEFDDTSTDVLYKGHIFKVMSMEQAEKAVDFIEEMINKGMTTFYIHCRAGMSRSQAFGEWIRRYCQNKEIDIEYGDDNNYLTRLNQGVLRRLNHAYWKKHKMYNYANGDDYENELIHPPLVEY